MQQRTNLRRENNFITKEDLYPIVKQIIEDYNEKNLDNFYKDKYERLLKSYSEQQSEFSKIIAEYQKLVMDVILISINNNKEDNKQENKEDIEENNIYKGIKNIGILNKAVSRNEGLNSPAEIFD